jgi:hypothetical protein
MSTYKKLNKQDAFITTYTAHKSWVVSGSQFGAYGIQVIPSANGIYLNSLQQLYYPTKVSGSAHHTLLIITTKAHYIIHNQGN